MTDTLPVDLSDDTIRRLTNAQCLNIGAHFFAARHDEDRHQGRKILTRYLTAGARREVRDLLADGGADHCRKGSDVILAIVLARLAEEHREELTDDQHQALTSAYAAADTPSR